MNIFDVPIITYHKISSQKEFGLTSITPETFYKQNKWLADQGYQTITFKEMDSGIKLPEKPIIISFDDTYKNVYENAFPILKEFNFKGVLFVISDYIGKKNNWEAYPIQRRYIHAATEEITEMHKNGFEIGSHCKTHRYLPHLDMEDLQTEFEDSKRFLENIIKTNIITCCYPYGGYNKKVTEITALTGFKYAVGNIKFKNTIPNKLELQRRSIYSVDSLSTFQKKISVPNRINFDLIKEWSIQKGAFAGIIKNKYL